MSSSSMRAGYWSKALPMKWWRLGGGSRSFPGSPPSPHRPLLPQQRRDHQVAEFHRAMVALKKNGAGLGFVGIDGNRRQAFHLALVDDGLAVPHHGDLPAHQAYVVGLPLAGGLAGVFAGEDAGV